MEAAATGDRILILPGVYQEEPSRAIPVNDPQVLRPRVLGAHERRRRERHGPDVPLQFECPLSRNLIAIIGDTDGDRRCDRRCHLQIEGMGRRPADVLIEGDRHKRDVIRADRADGFQIRNVTVEQAAFNNVDVVETNGFRLRGSSCATARTTAC